MKTWIAIVIAGLVVVGIVAHAKRQPATRDLARDVCENIIEQCGPLADPELAPAVPDLGGCLRKMDAQLEELDGGTATSLATCMADAESCEAVVGCSLTEGVRAKQRRRR